MNPSDFLFREVFYDTLTLLGDPKMRLAAWDALLAYGTKGVCIIDSLPLTPQEKSELKAILHQHKVSIDISKERYRRAVEGGKKGGRPRKTREPNGQA